MGLEKMGKINIFFFFKRKRLTVLPSILILTLFCIVCLMYGLLTLTLTLTQSCRHLFNTHSLSLTITFLSYT